ncbi:MAG: hypothetical protein OEZ15_00280 [Gammaproteobacteria bacterium]|nr:hypothetical protein [Gammaproteobacteria bacterium]
MKLHIPEQSDARDGGYPTHPKKVKKWLADLPQANMGEITKQIFSAIRELNRTKIPAKQRLEIMEMLREPCRSIFNNLKKYFINRTFPLPEKSKKIVNLNQSLLQEMALSYKIIIKQADDKSDKVDDKSQSIAIARATTYLSELLLRASEIYASVPDNTWQDAHQMFAYAVDNKLHRNVVNDNESPIQKTTIEDIYKHMLLFSLSRPTALRQSDSERVYKKLYEWVKQTNLGVQTQENQIDRFFCARIEEDRPPSYLGLNDCNSENKVFTLETADLVDNIRKEISSSLHKQDTITVGDNLSTETLKSLAMSWGVMPKRRFSRAGSQGHVVAAIGLSHAAKVIREGSTPGSQESMSSAMNMEGSFTLETIPEEYRAMANEKSGYMTHTEINGDSNDAWDMVAKGRAMTDAFDRQQKLMAEAALKLNKEDDDLHWEIVNISAGGYCLRWNSDTTSKAQIGELIAIQEREANGQYEWRVGTIRWMQFTAKHGLEIGVQVISPKVIAARVHRLHRPDETPFDALMIPGIRPLNQPATIVLPAHAFKTGDKLKVEVFEQHIEIKLSDRKEHTGSFTQFEFIHIDQDKQQKKIEKKQEAEKKKDDFDEIWSSL